MSKAGSGYRGAGHSTRRRIALVAPVVAGLVVAGAAWAAVEQGKWKGKIIDEPGSKVTFEIKNAHKGVDFQAKPVAVFCGIFPTGHLETRTVVIPKFRIDGNSVAGNKIYRDRRNGEVIGEVTMQAELNGKSKMAGAINYDDAQCSGEEEFTAKAK